MNRNKIHYITDQNSQIATSESIIFHEAGHAAAIYLNNKAQNLPPVFFQIILRGIRTEQEEQFSSKPIDGDCIDRIEGGRLIQSLLPVGDLTDDYLTACEADIVNLLTGPLAEAKFVHECDDELFNASLVDINALNNYGGQDDLKLAKEYLQSLYADKQRQDEKLHQLFIVAFNFVKDNGNWKSICRLANHIFQSNKSIISFEEVISVLEAITAEEFRPAINA